MGRNGPNLYELLKQAGSKHPADEPAAAPAEPASTTAAPPDDSREEGHRTAGSAPAKIVDPPPAPEPRVQVAAPPPRAEPVHEPRPPGARHAGLGERVLTVTWNTAAFAGLIALGVVFLAYAIGVRIGRASAEKPAAPAAPAARPVEPQPPAPPAVWTIRLMDWSARTSEEKLKGQENARKLRNTLAARQFSAADVKPLGDKIVLTYGRYADPASREAKEALAALREFRLARGQEPIFRNAALVRAE